MPRSAGRPPQVPGRGGVESGALSQERTGPRGDPAGMKRDRRDGPAKSATRPVPTSRYRRASACRSSRRSRRAVRSTDRPTVAQHLEVLRLAAGLALGGPTVGLHRAEDARRVGGDVGVLVSRGMVRLLALDQHRLATVGGDAGDLDLGRPALALKRDLKPLAKWIRLPDPWVSGRPSGPSRSP